MAIRGEPYQRPKRYNRTEMMAAAGAALMVGLVVGAILMSLLGPRLGFSLRSGGMDQVLAAAAERFPEAYAERAEVVTRRGEDGAALPWAVRLFIPARRFAEGLAPRTELLGDLNTLAEPFAVAARIDRAQMNARSMALALALAPGEGGACADYAVGEPRRLPVAAWPDRVVRQVEIVFKFDC